MDNIYLNIYNSDDLSDNDYSIVDYFSCNNCFNNNEYFTKKNQEIMTIINKYLPTEICKVIIEYILCIPTAQNRALL